MDGVHFISSGRPFLNKILKKGFPINHISLIYGEASTGKTTLVMQSSFEAVKQNFKVLYIDSDHSFSLNRLIQITGSDFKQIGERIVIFSPKDFDEQSKLIENLENYITKKEFGIYTNVIYFSRAYLSEEKINSFSLPVVSLPIEQKLDEHELKIIELLSSNARTSIVEIAEREKCPMHLVEQELLGITHMEIGYELAKLWQLPNDVAESTVHHHAPSKAQRQKYLSSLVYLADVVVRQMEIGHSGNYEEPEVADAYAKRLRLDLEPVLSQKDELLKQVEAIVSG